MPLTVPLIHHGLDDHWKHTPVQVKVQLRREGGDSGQSELDGAGALTGGIEAVGQSTHRRPFFSAGNGVKGHAFVLRVTRGCWRHLYHLFQNVLTRPPSPRTSTLPTRGPQPWMVPETKVLAPAP